MSSLDQLDVSTATSVQTYDVSTLYTSILHNLLKSRITALIHNSFKRRNGSNRYTHIKITSGKGYFIDTINPGGDNLYTADQICRMVELLIDNNFVKFGGCLFRQVIGIPVGTNCAPLLADLFLYSYESEVLDISPCGKKSCQTCNQFISNQSFKSNLTGKEYKTTKQQLMINFLVVHQILSMGSIVSIVVLYM